MTTDKTPTEALAQLRHLYAQLKSQDGMSRTDRARIADGILSPAIAALEKWGQPAQAAEPVAVVVPCYTPSGKRVALCSAKQDFPIGTQLYTAPQPSPTAQSADSVTAPAPPLECETEAEKRAFAFGWFKALEAERMKADNKKKDPL